MKTRMLIVIAGVLLGLGAKWILQPSNGSGRRGGVQPSDTRLNEFGEPAAQTPSTTGAWNSAE